MRLVATRGDQSLDFPLRQGSMLIGRHPSCHICIPAKGISRRHCQLYADGANTVLRDLGSANGTYVNNQRVEDRVDLHDGDVIGLGNLQLRFDLNEAAEPQPHAAQPLGADSGVIDVTPLGQAYPQQPAEPFPADAPPAPSDFPEPPQPDDTPVDADFVPPTYDPGAGPAPTTALAVSAGVPMQPQLVVRDGRWFLRDPRTGREVEISPKDPSAATALVRPEGAVPARRPNTRLLIGAIAVVGVLVAFAAVVLRPDEPGPRPGTIDRKTYYRHVDKALKAIIDEEGKPKDEATKTPKAIELLDRVNGLLPNIGVAGRLAGYVRLMRTLPDFEEDPKKFPWPQAKNPLESIMDAGTPSDIVNSYAERQHHRVETLLGVIARFDELIREGVEATTIEEKIEIWRKLGQLPTDTIVSKKAKVEEEKLRAHIVKHYRDRAKAAQDQSNWPDAVASHRQALRFATDEEKAEIQKQITVCQEDERDHGALEQARAAYKDGDRGRARDIAKGVPAASRFKRQADDLIKRIDADEAREAREKLDERVLARFRAGDGPGAMELALQGGAGDKYKYIERQFKEVERLMALGQKAEDEQKYAKAHEHYTAASQVIADPDNAYTKRANDALERLKAKHPQIAEEFALEGEKLIYTDPVKARGIFNKALQFDPTNKRAKKGPLTLHRVASNLHTEGSQLKERGQFLRALETLKKALKFADPGGALAVVIKRKIDQLEK